MVAARLALVPYVADTEVIDLPAEDPEMQVRILDDDGALRWHRWLPGSNGGETACGNLVDQRLTQGTRYPVCEGDLCPECFTVRELVKANLANAAARRRNT